MKKLLTVCVLGAISCSIYAQGLVSISENTAIISTNSASAGNVSGKLSANANSYYFELLTLADPTGSTTVPTITAASLSSWTDTLVTGTNGTGIKSGQVSGIPATTGVAVSGWAAGATNFTVVVGWSANEGSTWAQIASEAESGNWTIFGSFGMSAVGYLAAGQAPSPYPTVFGTSPGQLGAFTLQDTAVPEPGTMALAALGGASMLLFRRRK